MPSKFPKTKGRGLIFSLFPPDRQRHVNEKCSLEKTEDGKPFNQRFMNAVRRYDSVVPSHGTDSAWLGSDL